MQGAEGQRSRNPKKDETEYKHKVLLESGKVKRKACCIITLLLACNKEKPTEKLPGTPPFPTPSTDPLKEPAVPAATTAKSRRALLRLPPPPFCYISSLHLLCHMRVCVCVWVYLRASTVGCKQVPRLLLQPTATPAPPLPLPLAAISLSFPADYAVPAGCLAASHRIASHSHPHPLETLEAHSA